MTPTPAEVARVRMPSRFLLVADPILVVVGLLGLVFDENVTAYSYWLGVSGGYLLARWLGRVHDALLQAAERVERGL